MVSKVFWLFLGVTVVQIFGVPVTDDDYPDRDAPNEVATPQPEDSCRSGSSGLGKYLKCYRKGPMLSKDLLLPTKRSGVQVDTGPISCEEVTGYIMALNRHYSRRCGNMADKCPPEYRYAISWFGRVSHDMATKCDKEAGVSQAN